MAEQKQPQAELQDSNQENYTVWVLSEKHIDEAADIFAESFCNDEPLIKHMGISVNDFKPLARDIVAKASLDGFSVVATDSKGSVVGLTLSENLNQPIDLSNYPKFKPIFSLFEFCGKPLEKIKFAKNSVAHIWITAVKPECRGAKLSMQLNNASVTRAIESGFKYIYCEFTNPLNEKSMKFYPESIRINKINFKDFVFEGDKVFDDLEGYVSSYMVSAAPYIRIKDIDWSQVKVNWKQSTLIS